MNEAEELAMAGYHKVYDYTQYSHDNHVNIIPEEDFKHLVRDTFKVLADNLRRTYGPYGSQMIISEQSQTMTSKDGFNAFQSLGFSHTYKRIVYLAIQDIIKRVNRNVGDGTTTCILLAEKIFNNIDKIIKTPDDKRLLLETLTKIEKDFQDSSKIKRDIDAGIIKKPELFGPAPV
jgi:chaperonin GroEL (HSP60 family)